MLGVAWFVYCFLFLRCWCSLSTQVALVPSDWLYFGFSLQLNFQFLKNNNNNNNVGVVCCLPYWIHYFWQVCVLMRAPSLFLLHL